jgi:hypothetical protein
MTAASLFWKFRVDRHHPLPDQLAEAVARHLARTGRAATALHVNPLEPVDGNGLTVVLDRHVREGYWMLGSEP